MKNGKEIKKPSLYIGIPCYDMVKIQTMISMVKLVEQLTKAGIKKEVNTMKSPYIAYARNVLTARFMASDYDYLLFIDADVEFEPECPLRMLVAQEDIICTPYRIKTGDPDLVKYTTTVEDTQHVKILPGGLVEILQGPAGMMMIHRSVFETLMKKRPDLEIQTHQHKDLFPKDIKIFSFWDCTFKDGMWTGDDIAFCNLARSEGFKLYGNIESSLTHHGSYGYKGKWGDGFTIKHDER
jgi:hypothetical protein|tara:strand:- start:700 stop:1416 length:717 start_codon:yes stop_codon:yes gene_type:complete